MIENGHQSVVAADFNLIPLDFDLRKFMNRANLEFADPIGPDKQRPTWPVGTLEQRMETARHHFARYNQEISPEEGGSQYRIDNILVPDTTKVLNFEVIETNASDHAALVALIEV